MKLTNSHERWLILLIALHSLIIGIFLLALPDWTIRFGGWEGAQPLFFISQAGIFHVVLVVGYLIEHFRYQGVLLLISAKSMAFIFLMLTPIFTSVPWAVLVSGVGDGIMALVVFLVHRNLANRTIRE